MSESNPQNGIVTWSSRGVDSEGATVVSFRRSNLIGRPTGAGAAARSVTEIASLTGTGNYFDDFDVGTAIRHARGKTITPLETILIRVIGG